MNDIAQEIACFIRRNFQIAERDTRFNNRAHLWEEGYIDSVGAAELITFLQERFQVEIPDDALFAGDCATVDDLARLVAQLLAKQGALT